MKLHLPSFALGFGSAAVLIGAKETLRPVAVEIGALGVHVGRLGRALLARQREHVEDFWAEIEEAARRRARRARAGEEPEPRFAPDIH